MISERRSTESGMKVAPPSLSGLEASGILKAFSGTRTFHHLLAVMEEGLVLTAQL